MVALSLMAGCGDELPTPDEEIQDRTSLLQGRDTPDQAADHLAWLVHRINRNQGRLREEEILAHFHISSLQARSARGKAAAVARLAETHAPITILGVERREHGRLLVQTRTADGNMRIRLTLDEPSGLIRELRFVPYLSLAKVASDVSSLAPQTQLLIAEVQGRECRPLYEVNSGEPLAVGSTFKLYVLLSLVDHILSGEITWESEEAIRDRWKSLPFGTMQDEPQGALFSLYSFAENMISVSDNTATDHLIYTLGRERVETTWRAVQHHPSSLNAPLLSTREFFLFHLALSLEAIDDYLGGDEAHRREYLDVALANRTATRAPDVDKLASYHPARIQWFASAGDLCDVMALLSDRARSHEAAAPVLDILAKQPGVTVSSEIWPYIGHKAGWWRGARNVSWLLHRDDGRVFFVTLGLGDPTGAEVDKTRMFALVYAIFELLADEDR